MRLTRRKTELNHGFAEFRPWPGAKHLVTSCGQCRITLEMDAKHAHWDKTVESLLGLVADNLAV